ncbi:MAG: hypothetical protein IKN43_02275 [Selenomonadaceae bacterium]|nr:hypothetical protein [Selenomonadaceae bacterium]
MREIFRYKTKNILYFTGEFEEDEEDKKKKEKGKKAAVASQDVGLSPEELAIVEHSKSDNRISDSVADLVAMAEGGEALLTDEQRRIVESSKSDNRISDSVADIVAHNV